MTATDKIVVITPSSSMSVMPTDMRRIGVARLNELGFTVFFGEHIDCRRFHTAGDIHERLSDIECAFSSPEASVVMAAFGGYTSNQLLDYLDFEKIGKYEKCFIGFSDITALLLPLATRTNMLVLHGPSFSVFCDPDITSYTTEGFVRCLAGKEVIYQSPHFTASDKWWQKEGYGPREWTPFEGWRVYRSGEARGKILGGNLQTICALAGTKYFPSFHDCILFVEDAEDGAQGTFHRDLVHLAQMGVFRDVVGVIIGKPPNGSALSEPGCIEYTLDAVLGSDVDIPVLYDVTCSHVDPIMTIPLERMAFMQVSENPTIRVNIGK